MAFWDRATSIFGGIAVGGSARAGLDPIFEPARQNSWARRPFRTLNAAIAARVRARQDNGDGYGGIDRQGIDLNDDARRDGVGSHRFNVLTELAREYPGVGQLLTLVQRAEGGDAYQGISRAHFNESLRRQGFTSEGIDTLYKLTIDLLSVAEIANAVQQGHVPNEGVLPEIDPSIIFPAGYDQPPAPDDGPPSHVPLTQLPISPRDETLAQGWDVERLQVLANLAGLPPGPEALLAMWNRNLIDESSVDAGIREGHMKTKWAHAFKRMRWHVLSAPEYAGLWLRGWITKAAAIRGGALTGATPEQMDLLYKNRGRPMAPVQAFTAWARGAPHPVGEGIPDRAGTFDYQDFKRAIQQSDIRTEYVDPLWHIRHAYPSLFQLRRAVQDGGISRARALTILKYQRYEDTDATALVDSWTTGTGTTAKGLTVSDLATEYEGLFLTRASYIAGLKELGFNDAQANEKADAVDARRTRTARGQLVDRIHSQYVNHRISRDRALGALTQANVPARVRNLLMPDWDLERDLTADALTPAQIKKAYRRLTMTRDVAVDRLEAKGYEADDASEYLDQ